MRADTLTIKTPNKKTPPADMIWEEMPNYHYATTYRRTKIFGGWLVESCSDVYHVGDPNYGQTGSGYDWRTSVTFVPDPAHEWEL